MADRLYNDFETFSKVELPDVGADVYSRHPSTKPLMLSYALNSGKVQQWLPAEREPMPRELKQALLDPEVIKTAWNMSFEWHIYAHCLGIKIPVRQTRCTMTLASTVSLPMQLAKAGQVLGIPAEKAKLAEGKKLIRLFCGPIKPTKKFPANRANWLTHPEQWEHFKLYNRQDTEAERAIYQRIRKWDMPDHEWELWFLDHKINQRGIPINLDVVENACRTIEYARRERFEELEEITGLDNPGSRDQLLGWLRGRGYPFYDLTAGHVKREIEELKTKSKAEELDEDEEQMLRVLTLRSEISRTSVDKFFALERATAEDGNLRNSFQFAGAGRTWRWSGRIYQPQNLAKPSKEFEEPEATIQCVTDLETMSPEALSEKYPNNLIDMISACVRPVVQAPEGYLLIDADLNAIENRVLGWMADDRKILKVFKQDRDPYVDFATYMYGMSYEAILAEVAAGNKSKRTFAKPGVLGCGYMLSAGYFYDDEKTGEQLGTGLLGYAANMGVKLTPELAKLSVDTWRATFKDAVDFWYAIERAAMRCVATGKRTECWPVWFDISGPLLRMNLPSGRALHYVRPRIETKRMPWGKDKQVLTYEGLNDKRQWARIDTHPGKLTENADQAISRDALAHGMKLAEAEGIRIRIHVHDQLAALVREDGDPQRDLKILTDCMSVSPPWAPTLPLKAVGTVSKYFLKD